MSVHLATPADEVALSEFMATFEPVVGYGVAHCSAGCGRQVVRPGALCIRCANRRESETRGPR